MAEFHSVAPVFVVADIGATIRWCLVSRLDGLRERGGVQCVQDFFARDPAAAGHRDAVLDVVHRLHRVRVSGHDEFNLSLARLT